MSRRERDTLRKVFGLVVFLAVIVLFQTIFYSVSWTPEMGENPQFRAYRTWRHSHILQNVPPVCVLHSLVHISTPLTAVSTIFQHT